MNPRRNYIYPLLIVFQCVIFGASFIFLKGLLDAGVPTFLLIGLRFSIGAIFLLVLSRSLNLSKQYVSAYSENNKITRHEAFMGGLAGLVLFSAYAFQTIGATSTTPAKSSLYTDLFVIFVPIIEMIFIKKKFSLKPLVTPILAFIGVMVLVDIFSEAVSFSTGDFWTILCGIAFTIHFILLERILLPNKTSRNLNSYNFTIMQLLTIAILSIFISLVTETKLYNSFYWSEAILGLLFLGILATSIAYLIQFIAQKKISASTTSVISCSEAIFTFFFSLIFGFDSFSIRMIIGGMIIVFAMVLSSVDFKIG